MERFDGVTLQDGEIRCTVIGGAEPAGICGSGLIDAVAVLLEAGIIDETGAIQDEGHPFADRVTELDGEPAVLLAGTVLLTQEDIPEGAAGQKRHLRRLKTLVGHVGLSMDQVDRLLIAGGFGRHIRLENAGGDRAHPAGPLRQGAGDRQRRDYRRGDDPAKPAVSGGNRRLRGKGGDGRSGDQPAVYGVLRGGHAVRINARQKGAQPAAAGCRPPLRSPASGLRDRAVNRIKRKIPAGHPRGFLHAGFSHPARTASLRPDSVPYRLRCPQQQTVKPPP